MRSRMFVVSVILCILVGVLAFGQYACTQCASSEVDVETFEDVSRFEVVGCTAPPPDPYNCWKFVRCCGDGTWLYMRCIWHGCLEWTWAHPMCYLLGQCPWCTRWGTVYAYGCFPPDGYPEIAGGSRDFLRDLGSIQ